VFSGPVLAPVLYSLYINYALAATGTLLGLFVDDICIYTSDNHALAVLYKLQHGLTAVKAWSDRCNININERKSRAMCFSKILKSP
jgi:hypothetical protein